MTVLTFIQGHDGSLLVKHEDGRVAMFYNGRAIITGMRDQYGQCRLLTAGKVRTMYQVRDILRKPYDQVDVFDGRGMFDPITAHDIWSNRRAYGHIPVPIRVLTETCRYFEKKG